MQRRAVLLGLAGGGASALATWAGAPAGTVPARPVSAVEPLPAREGTLLAASEPAVPHGQHHHHGPAGPRIIDHLPLKGEGHARDIALTIDDGTDTDVVGAFLVFAQKTGIKLTFFPNGVYRSWTEHQKPLRALVEAGQVQVGNHTWSHPFLTRISDQDVFQQLDRNDKFLTKLLGVSPRPWFRPPYGAHDERVDRIAADLGYTRITLWNGTFGDDIVLTPAQLLAQASQWIGAGRIVIGHANHPAVTHCYPQLAELISSRKLVTRTLTEAFAHE